MCSSPEKSESFDLSELTRQLRIVSDKVSAIEERSFEFQANQASGSSGQQGQFMSKGSRDTTDPEKTRHSPPFPEGQGAAGPGHVSVTDVPTLERDFEVIKDCLNKIKLPEDLKLIDSKQGIKKEDQGALHIISKNARYVETAMKWLSTQDDTVHPELSHLYTILRAQMQFLQTEYSALVVKGTFDEDTAKIFKCLQKNTLNFRGDALNQLRSAAEISAAKQHQRATSNQWRGSRTSYRGRPDFRYSRGRGRGMYRDPYRQFQGGYIPPQRPTNDNSGVRGHDEI
jgi:hypothetical protein